MASSSNRAKDIVLVKNAYNTLILRADHTTLIKRQIPVASRERNIRGEIIEQHMGALRFQNEANALQLFANLPDIRVPKLFNYGRDDDETWWLEIEYIGGTVAADEAGYECRMDDHRPPAADGSCSQCQGIAEANVRRYVEDKLIPALARKRSKTTGINGIVIPPHWVAEHDVRPSWPVLRSKTNDFSLWIPDFRLDNILVSTQTLKVVALIDLEDAGFFPPQMHRWMYYRSEHFALYGDMGLVHRHINYLDPKGGCRVEGCTRSAS